MWCFRGLGDLSLLEIHEIVEVESTEVSNQLSFTGELPVKIKE